MKGQQDDLRIVIASPGGLSGGGGMGSVTRGMVSWLQRGKIQVDVIDPWGEHPPWLWPVHLAVSIVRLLWLRWVRGANLLHLQVSERSSFVRKGVLLAVGKGLRMGVVLHHHGAELIPFVAGAPRPLRLWVRWVVRLADRNIVLGQRFKSVLVNDLGEEPQRVSVLWNATEDLKRPGVMPARNPDEVFHLLLIANLSPRKGVSEFLLALKGLNEDGYRVRATLAGGGDLHRYREETNRLDISHLATFTGWVAQSAVVALIRSADALVLPSHDEGMPMVILEALSAGLPVVATPVGSIPEILIDGVNSLLVPVGNVSALSTAMRNLIVDPALRRRLATQGRLTWEQNFGLNACMTHLIKLYEECRASGRNHSAAR